MTDVDVDEFSVPPEAAPPIVKEDGVAITNGNGETITFERTPTSISEAAEDSSTTWKAPSIIKWIEIPFRIKDPNTERYLSEATGWAMDGAARGPLNQVGGYIGSAILRMALVDANCTTPTTCERTFGGIKPTSLLTLTTTVVGVIAALLMPIFGAIVDHTRHRKLVGIISGFMVVFITGLQIGISAEKLNWLYVLVLDGLQSFALLVHATAVFAYLPDLTTDAEAVPAYTTHFNIRQFGFQITYLIFVVGTGQIRGKDRSLESAVETARDATGIAFGYAAIFILYSWTFLFHKRPALTELPKGTTLLTASFVQIFRTSGVIFKRYNALKWFMLSLLWSPEAGAGVVLSMAVTYLTTLLKRTPMEIAYTSFILLLSTIPGAFLSRFLCRKINPLNSYRFGLLLLALGVGLFSAIADGPEKGWTPYAFAPMWGVATGWVYASQRVLFVTLIPKGQETEFMGLFFFIGQILGWAPPLIYTAFNENGISQQWGLSVVSFLCVLAVITTLPMGNYQAAVDLAREDSKDKYAEVLEATATQKVGRSMNDEPNENGGGIDNSTKDKPSTAGNTDLESAGDTNASPGDVAEPSNHSDSMVEVQA